ncbi:hypothetical protein ISN45_Aa05g009150 [Arabidopsis thaliana x Arabidopsis arenosa]|uniref:Uncharacterized protein n=1 Tax=Arabidopsis thaliana x Arabidopsis arenosa TaxID=1240361 RepID=A0A8T1ZJH6_9BRAS|nr:hypothetical protein ISN45_Aa05g009150 [Arabidopsis thaliana x Arabidopsis arenosa]
MHLVRSSINNKGRRWCPAIPISHPQRASPLRKLTLIEPPNFRIEILFTRKETSHQAKAYDEVLLNDMISPTGTAMFLWFASTASNPDQNHQMLPIPSPEMHVSPQNFSSSPYSGRRTQDLQLPVKRKLGQLVDFFMSGPLRCRKPNFKRGDPNPSLQKPRSALIYSLSILYQFLNHLSAPLDRGRQRNRNVSVLLWMFKNNLRTLPLDSPSFLDHEIFCLKKKGTLFPSPISRWCDCCHQSVNCLSPTHLITNFKQSLINKARSSWDYKENFRIFEINHEPSHHALESKRWKKNGIMIPSLRSGGYRRFFHLSPSFHLFTKIRQVRFNIIKVSIRETESLKKNGTMTPFPRSGGYQSFINPLYPFPLNYELKPVPKETYIFQDILPLVPRSSLRLVPANQETKDTFSTSQDLLIVTIANFRELFAEVSMTHHEVACGLLLDCFGLRFSMEYQNLLSFFVVSLSSLKIIVLFFMLGELVNFAPMGLIE